MSPIRWFRSENGSLLVQDKPVEEIVQKTGSPLYLYDAGIMRDRYEALGNAIPENFSIHYSLKANPNIEIARKFQQMGAGAEVASAQELKAAFKAGFAPGKTVFAGPGKSVEELRLAVKKGIAAINVESATELDRISEIAKKSRSLQRPAKVVFRVNLEPPDVSDSTGHIMTGGPKKFGIDDTDIAPLVKRAVDDANIDFCGFHCYPGTQLTSARALGSIYRRFTGFAKDFVSQTGIEIKLLNFGGGLGIPFTDKGGELDIISLGKTLGRLVDDLAKRPGFGETKFMLEPGRFLVGPAGVYISRITDIKTSRGKTFVLTDGGIHHALIPIVMNKNYPSTLVNRMDERKRVECAIAGPLCSSADQLSRSVKLPPPQIGDLLGIFNSGAYGFTAGMVYFLSHPTPAEVLADNGSFHLIRPRKNPDMGIRKTIKF